MRIISLLMTTFPGQEEYLLKGHNGLETCVLLSERGLLGTRRTMKQETVKDVLRRFNEANVRYCLVGGLALAHHSVPRQTQDVDIMVLPEDLQLVQHLLQGHKLYGTAVVMVFQIGETRIDIIPANLRASREAVLGHIEDLLDGMTVRVVNLRDLILLKLWAIPQRLEKRKRMLDETDVVGLIELNPEKISSEDIAYISQNLLALAYTPGDTDKYRAQVEWLNDVLRELGLNDLCYHFT
jgi:predicted nucleotidyltransferase